MKTLTVISFILWSLIADAQVISGVVYDSLTRYPVSYATVKILNHDKGTYTDKNGNFKIDSINNYVVARISHVAFESKITRLNGHNNNILLNPRLLELDEVVVSSDKLSKQTILGITKGKKRKMKLNIEAFEIGRYFCFEPINPMLLESFSIPVVLSDVKVMFKLKVYNFSNGFPDSLIFEQVFTRGKRRKETVTFDLNNPLKITEPSKMFFSIEILGYETKTEIFDSTAKEKAITVFFTNNLNTPYSFTARSFRTDPKWYFMDENPVDATENPINIIINPILTEY